MKRKTLLLFAISWLFIPSLTAQNPFKEFGYEVGVITLSKGKYIEFIPNDSIHRIGTVKIDTRTGEIVELINTDSIEVTYNYMTYVASRWISPDPLSEEYPKWSPYAYVKNNPINYLDPDGRYGLPVNLKSKYKYTDEVLKNIGSMRTDKRLVEAYKNNSGLSESRINDYLTYEGGSPTINVENMLDHGSTTFDGKISISKDDVKGLEKWGGKVDGLKDKISSLDPAKDGKKIGKLEEKLEKANKEFGAYKETVEKTVLHEGVHKGDIEANGTATDYKKADSRNPRAGKQNSISKERGESFEEEYYGKTK